MELALGKYKESSQRSKLHELCKFLKGQCALLFTNLEPKELRNELDAYRSQEYSRTGMCAEQTVSYLSYILYAILLCL